MRWLVLCALLAGCTSSVESDVPVVHIITESEAATAEIYTFVLFGNSRVEEARTVTMRIDADGDPYPDHIIDYVAEPDAPPETIAIYETDSPYLSFDVIADNERIQTVYVDMSECRNNDADAAITVFESRFRYGDRNVEINYGCSS